eukprot:3905208-Pyramimonas_sp.AAC.1
MRWKSGVASLLSDYGGGANCEGDSLSHAPAAAIVHDRNRRHLARRARSKSRSATPARKSTMDDLDERRRRAEEKDEAQRRADPRAALIGGYLVRRAEGQSDGNARRAVAADVGAGPL